MASIFQFSGSLSEISISDAVRLLQSTGRTGCLTLSCPGGRGAIYFENGAIVEAQSSQLSGRDAIKLLAVFNQGTFEFSNSTPSLSRTLMSDSTDALIEIIEGRELEATQIRELIPQAYEVPCYLGGALPNNFELTASELAVVMKATGGMLSVGQLAEQLGLDLLLVGYTIARFRAIGLIDFRELDEIPAPVPATPVVEAPAPAAPIPSPDPSETKPRYWRGRRIN